MIQPNAATRHLDGTGCRCPTTAEQIRAEFAGTTPDADCPVHDGDARQRQAELARTEAQTDAYRAAAQATRDGATETTPPPGERTLLDALCAAAGIDTPTPDPQPSSPAGIALNASADEIADHAGFTGDGN